MRILTVFLSAGKSLCWWDEEGVFSREILVYRELLRAGAFDRVRFFSYDARDRDFIAARARNEPLYERIDILAPRRGRGAANWAIRGVLAHRRAIAESAMLKTNQISGAWAAILASRLTGRPLVLRLGYVLSRRFALNHERGKALAARTVEWAGARRAARVIVTSKDAADHFGRDKAVASKVRLLPTYVDVDTFIAQEHHDFDAPLIAVGRMRPQKNLAALLRACALAGADLVLVGRGEGEAELRDLAAELPIRVEFAGQIDNVALAHRLGHHAMFVLPSLHEGLPKVLIEAMASGLICVASRIPGVTDLIEDEVTGYLIDGFSPEDIARAITRAKKARDPSVGARARALIEARFGLRGYAAAEAAVYAEIA
ncbi:MAG TPA: glycosyltransferase family 4 protein [Sphingomonas sp.]|jgi:glycosyltransferase involved in cell wall biosynthesis|uniref:glycosyltransferase family 4 protein n=1 Tax=Sphingomonas sp. TaxID=28214 RepID=UPI002EDA1AF3